MQLPGSLLEINDTQVWNIFSKILSCQQTVTTALFADLVQWLLVAEFFWCAVTFPCVYHLHGNCTDLLGNCTDTPWKLYWNMFRFHFTSWHTITLLSQVHVFVGKSTSHGFHIVLLSPIQLIPVEINYQAVIAWIHFGSRTEKLVNFFRQGSPVLHWTVGNCCLSKKLKCTIKTQCCGRLSKYMCTHTHTHTHTHDLLVYL